MQRQHDSSSRNDPLHSRHTSKSRRNALGRTRIRSAINPFLEKLEGRLLLSAAGSLDSTFGSGGLFVKDLGGQDQATSIDAQAGGDLIVAGVSSGHFVVS